MSSAARLGSRPARAGFRRPTRLPGVADCWPAVCPRPWPGFFPGPRQGQSGCEPRQRSIMT
eukprot:8559946-Lingulodinium_polyedra.AAC.1